MDHRDSGPPWTGGHCRSRELAGARPPTAPGLGITGEEAGEVEEATGITLACSSELGKQRIGGATALRNPAASSSVGARYGAGEEERRVW